MALYRPLTSSPGSLIIIPSSAFMLAMCYVLDFDPGARTFIANFLFAFGISGVFYLLMHIGTIANGMIKILFTSGVWLSLMFINPISIPEDYLGHENLIERKVLPLEQSLND